MLVFKRFMDYIKKVIKHNKKFGLRYFFYYALYRFHIIEDLPVKLLIKKQEYYKNLNYEQQKKELSETYKYLMGKTPDLDNPQTFTEKIQWLKLHNSTQQKADFSDKYLAPKLLQQKNLKDLYFIKQIGEWDKAEDIDFNSLPQSFVLKCNHGSAMNIIVKDKTTLNITKTKKILNDWLKIDYAYVNGMYENHYTLIKPKIIAEEYIKVMSGRVLKDYKFHCFMGKPEIIELIADREPNTHFVYTHVYDANWNKVNIHFNDDFTCKEDYEKPEQLPRMLELAAELSKDFCYVRVDFYIINNKIYFGELTFTPDSGLIKFEPEEVDLQLGKLINLPQ